MLNFASNLRIFLHARPTDMRKSFDGLCGLVRSELQADPLDGSLFLFVNRRGDRIKMLWWDRDGLALFYKRLESGTFEMLRSENDAAAVELDATTLAMLLGGVALDSVKRRKRYSRRLRRLAASSERAATFCEKPFAKPRVAKNIFLFFEKNVASALARSEKVGML